MRRAFNELLEVLLTYDDDEKDQEGECGHQLIFIRTSIDCILEIVIEASFDLF